MALPRKTEANLERFMRRIRRRGLKVLSVPARFRSAVRDAG
jgi:acetolactate synthase regulatory subunit